MTGSPRYSDRDESTQYSAWREQQRQMRLWTNILVAFLAFLVLVCITVIARAEETDYGRTCLALVGYSEARGEGLAGMLATEQVVINRLLSRRWGDSICEVAFGNGQFLGVANWPPPRIPREQEAWGQAQFAADLIIENVDAMPEGCGDALYFTEHKPKVYLCKIGKLYFY